jgi:hypothetical protein
MEVNQSEEFTMDTESHCLRRKHNMKNAMATTSGKQSDANKRRQR